tara:strand:- start:494 stop:832 length:339 start_codon:yes stop_codon:yes gene_type:complete
MESRKIEIVSEVDLSQSLDFDPDSGLVVNCFVHPLGDDLAVHEQYSFETLVDDTIELNTVNEDYQSLYCVAHELTRHSEKLRDCANRLEDANLVEDIFNVDIHDLIDVDTIG